MRKLTVLLLLLMLAGCSSKFAYRNLDWLTYWYIDDYIEFTDQQETIFDNKLGVWLAWHEKAELPLYQEHLNELAQDITEQKLDLVRLTYHQEKFANHWQRLKIKIIPDLVSMAVLLSPQQVNELFVALNEHNIVQQEELDEYYAKTPAQQKEFDLKKRNKGLTRWIGPLTNEQSALIETSYDKHHENKGLWIAYRVRYQNTAKSLFDKPARGDDFKQQLTTLLLHPQTYKGEDLTQRNNENVTRLKSYLVTLDASLTVKQRQHFSDKLLDFSDDINDILN